MRTIKTTIIRSPTLLTVILEKAAAQESDPPLALQALFSIHVCDPLVDSLPAAAVAESVYPVEQAEQSTPATSQRVPADPVATVGVPFGQVQTFAEHPTPSTKVW